MTVSESTPEKDREGVGWHWGPDPAFGNLCRHVGPRERCSGPDCGSDETYCPLCREPETSDEPHDECRAEAYLIMRAEDD